MININNLKSKRRIFIIGTIFSILFTLTLNLTTVSAHSFGNYVLINNEFLIEDYNGPESSILTYNQHFVGKYFGTNENINFKIRLSELGFLLDLDCEVILSDNRTIKTDPYEVNYEGLDTYYKGVEFNLNFEKTGSYIMQIVCKKFGSEDSRKFVDEYITIHIGEKLDFPETILINNKEVKFRQSLNINFDSDIEFKIKDPKASYEYTWGILTENDNVQKATLFKNKFQQSEKPVYIVLKVYDTKSNIYEDNYFSVIPNTKQSFQSKYSDLIAIIQIVGILGLIITPILLHRKS